MYYRSSIFFLFFYAHLKNLFEGLGDYNKHTQRTSKREKIQHDYNNPWSGGCPMHSSLAAVTNKTTRIAANVWWNNYQLLIAPTHVSPDTSAPFVATKRSPNLSCEGEHERKDLIWVVSARVNNVISITGVININYK